LGIGPIPNPQSPIPNPQSPFSSKYIIILFNIILWNNNFNKMKKIEIIYF